MAVSAAATALVQDVWTEVTGALGSVAGVTWVNNGPNPILMAFGLASAPAAGEGMLIERGAAFWDTDGSTKIWAKAIGGPSSVAPTQD